MQQVFRLLDFNIYNENITNDDDDNNEPSPNSNQSRFLIQMFGIDEVGDSYSVIIENYKPFFYILVGDDWNISKKDEFLENIKGKMGYYYKDTITGCIIVKRKKLYGFDGGKTYKFIRLEFSNIAALNKAKGLWYGEWNKNGSGRKLLPNGYVFKSTNTKLYEANIPPLLRFIHIKDISPSGWVALPVKNIVEVAEENKTTNCKYEYVVECKNIIPLNNKETRVPYKICSFDIEASSSHGDFPVPIKSYKKLALNIVDYFENNKMVKDVFISILRRIIFTAFGYDNLPNIDIVYPITNPAKSSMEGLFERLLISNIKTTNEFQNIVTIESLFEKMRLDDDNEDDTYHKKHASYAATNDNITIIDILMDVNMEREHKLIGINTILNSVFPKLHGDKVTFIGSTFTTYGSTENYLNHCIVLNTCEDIPTENTVIESYSTEKQVLLAWQQLIQREDPDIIIGYNIFGFDYEFMFRRAGENDCVEEFLKLSRNSNEICATKDKDSGKYKIEESNIQIASGQHDIKFIKMNGRIQIDLYNFFRREENLTSYKLDYVAGHFICDYVKKIEFNIDDDYNNITKITTENLSGLNEGNFVHFEEIGNSIDYYADGAKFKVVFVNKKEKYFEIEEIINPNMSKKVKWCLAKDDVTPKDIFRMTNGTDQDRSIIAKYCIQDCNLVHHLMNKVDILTGFIEMSKICSVPISFLVMRGQGIKLTSYIAKKCREKNTLMPVLDKGDMDEGYEGAIVLDPKCDLYLDNPVACVDYASLYPSSMISENLSHDSKVWTIEYDLNDNIILEYGEKNRNGEFIYDNLPDYDYVNITYDTYKYVKKTPSSSAEKVKSGKKICRFAQFKEGKAIMPSILEELLHARKTTRKLIPLQTDDFMKNVLDKRQLGYKVTANSLYGQCGAKTSTFYEKDIAACTTSTGRLLLTYAKRIIEETYNNKICNTKNHGEVLTNAEYIYGDTDSVFFTFNLKTLEGENIRGAKALEITIELAQEAGHYASSFLKKPHDLEYEKTFMPFCLLAKKKYVGMLYETDPNKCKRKEMGIVLKRRDNAPIVKDIYGGILDILMKKQNIQEAINFLKMSLSNIVNEKYGVDKLIITKAIRTGYKNPKSIAHKVLADRMAARDIGNKPCSGDRIPFIYIHNPNKKALQGDKIETPTYIKENNIKIDYSFYITNQIMKPVQQLFSLVLEKIWEMQNKKAKISKFKMEVKTLHKTYPDNAKFQDKLDDLKNKEIKILLFDEYLREANNEKSGNQNISSFFKKV